MNYTSLKSLGNKEAPKWIMFFTWLFFGLGLIIPIVIMMNLFGQTTLLSLYGISAISVLNLKGLFLLFLFAFKFKVAHSILKREPNCWSLAMDDAYLGIFVCVIGMIISVLMMGFSGNLELRLELVILIPYLRTVKRLSKGQEKLSEEEVDITDYEQ